jgi:uncharacterized protein (TIGR02453 family)
MKQVLQFLQELSENNNREWFQLNRARYNESREKMVFITDILISEIRKFDPDIPYMDPKDCLFRIFRDVRFSNDKSPYKTHFGSFIARGGRKSLRAGYYIHIEPGGSFIGGGLYRPPADSLKSVRRQIERHPGSFLEIISHPSFKAVFPAMMDDQLKTAPRGFAKDHEYIHLLRYKSYVFSSHLGDEVLQHGDFMKIMVNAFGELYKLNAWLNEALG